MHRLCLSLQLHLLLSFFSLHEGRHRSDCPMPVPSLFPEDHAGVSHTFLSFSVPRKLKSPFEEAVALPRC